MKFLFSDIGASSARLPAQNCNAGDAVMWAAAHMGSRDNAVAEPRLDMAWKTGVCWPGPSSHCMHN